MLRELSRIAAVTLACAGALACGARLPTVSDAGVSPDGGAPADAGGAGDAGSASDAGTTEDAGTRGDPFIACDGGLCSVETVATNVAWPRALAVSSTHVAWAGFGDGTVWVASATEPAITPLRLTALALTPGAVALDTTHVYWTDADEDHIGGHAGGVLARGPLHADGGVTPFASALHHPAALAVDATHVYWGDLENGGVWRADKSLGASSATQLTANTSTSLIALDDTHVYWASKDQFIVRVPRTGGEATRLATLAGDAAALALDETHVYWSRGGNCIGGDGALFRAPKTGIADAGLAQPLLELTGDHSEGIAVDAVADRLYFTRACTGTVAVIPRSGGAERTLATRQEGAAALALGTTHLYWTTIATPPDDPGAVYRIRRTP